LNKDKKKLYSSTFDVTTTVATIFLLTVAILSITEITSERYPAYGSNSSSNGSASITTNTNNPTSLPTPDFNFVVVGDWGCTDDTTDTVNNIANKNPELVLGLGDYSYEDSEDCWFGIVQPIDSIMNVSIGNHDVEKLEKLEAIMNHFGLTQQYYSFNYKNIHFLALSTEIPFDVNSAQYIFVNNDLSKAASNPNIDWIIVYYHRPMYTLPTKHPALSTLRSIYHPLFEKYGVDLVIQGHNHNYQRTYPIKFNSVNPENPIQTSTNTTTYINQNGGQIFAIVGTGGEDIYPFEDQKDTEKENNYYAKDYEGFGILDVDITNNGKTLTGKFYPNNNGTIIDQFTIIK